MSAQVGLQQLRQELAASRRSLYLGRGGYGVEFGGWQDHLLTLGPTRCGKTSGLIAPSVAIHPGPVVATSTRSDIVAMTAGAREAEKAGMGAFEVCLGTVGTGLASPVSWSVTDGCDDWNLALDRAGTLAAVAMPRDDERFWRNTASDLLAGCLFGAALLGDDDHTMAQWIKSTNISRYHEAILEYCPEGHQATYVFSGIADPEAMADDTRRSVFATVSAQVLSQFRYDLPSVEITIDLASFVNSNDTLYLIVPDERAEELRPLVTSFVSAVIGAWRARQRADATLLLALDEVANVAPLPTLTKLITAGAGDGIQCLLGMQEPGQASRWGGEASVITGGTTHLALFPGLRNSAYLEELTKLLGQSVQYDLQVEVRSKVPGGSRFVDEATLIAERLEIERARQPERGIKRELAAKKAAARIAARRLRAGLRNRVEDAAGPAGAVLEEVERYTSLRQVPQRRASVEPERLAQAPRGQMFLLTGARGEFRQVQPWQLDLLWASLWE